MKKLVIAACTLALAGGLLAGCSSNTADTSKSSDSSSATTAATTEQKAERDGDVEMKYMTPAEVEGILSDDSYLIVDVRKAEDYAAGHIPGAINADMDKAKDGDLEDGTANMTAALKEATGEENGAGKKMVLVCYSGKRYAQAGTNVLYDLGVTDGVYTLEGGMKAWTGATEA